MTAVGVSDVTASSLNDVFDVIDMIPKLIASVSQMLFRDLEEGE